MKLKRLLFSIVLSLTMLTGCGAPPEMVEEADNIKAENLPKFEQAVKDVYGKDAELINVKCGVELNIGSPVPNATYSLPTTMEGQIELPDKRGKAIYKIDSGAMYDNVNTSNILDSFLDQLPYNKEEIVTKTFLDSSSNFPMFKSGLTTYDEVLNTPNSMYSSYPRLYMTTLEDLSAYKDIDINNLDVHKKMYSSAYPINYVLCGVTVESKAMLLDNDFTKIQFNYKELPYYEIRSGEEEQEDVMKKFGITSYITYNYFHPEDSYQVLDIESFE